MLLNPPRRTSLKTHKTGTMFKTWNILSKTNDLKNGQLLPKDMGCKGSE